MAMLEKNDENLILSVVPRKATTVPRLLIALIHPIISRSTSQKMSWDKVKGADGYFIYASECSTKKKTRKLKRICTISSADKTSYVRKKLKKNNWYKYEIRAYRNIDGKKVVFGHSVQLHALTLGNKKYANPLRVRITGGSKCTLKVGQVRKLRVKALLPKGKRCQWHTSQIRYVVSNPKIVSVGKNGKLIACRGGKTVIYAIAQNGVMDKIKIRVNP